MDDFIECAELGIVRDIPAEMLKLEQQNAELLQSNRFLKHLLIASTVGVGVIIVIQLINAKRDEERTKNTGKN